MGVEGAHQLTSDALAADVCIIGAGAAGLALAADLDGSDQQVLVLEAGGATRDLTLEAEAFEVDLVGEPWRNPEPARGRMFGGSTSLWFGRLAIPQPIDFEQRSWVPHSGWPIAYDTLSPFLAAATRLVSGPAVEDFDISRWPATNRTVDTFRGQDDTDLAVFMWAGEPDVGVLTRPALERSRNVRVVLDATVTELVPDSEHRRIERVEARRPDGRTVTITARRVVLAAGGLENPRLLLASTTGRERGLGNEHDLVGRFFMDHPRGQATATVELRDCTPDQIDRVRFMNERTPSPAGPVQLGVTFSVRKQEAEGLLNHVAHAHLSSDAQQSDGYHAVRRLLDRARRRGGGDRRPTGPDVMATLRDAPTLARFALAKARHRVHPTRLLLIDQMEQEPDPDSRVTLDHRSLDRFGLPRLRVDWRIGESTYRSQRVMHETIRDTLARHGLTAFRSDVLDHPERPPELWDMKHPSGTTRMSTDAATGVVDGDGRVHGIANLYVLGSSTFPTVGHHNPTLLILALALRLGAHLRGTSA